MWMQVCIAAFTKSWITVKAHCWNKNVGGRNMDWLLCEHFASEFKAQTGDDIAGNSRARVKLMSKVSRCRELLTASRRSYINVDNLTAANDFRCGTRLRKQTLPCRAPEHTLQVLIDFVAMMSSGKAQNVSWLCRQGDIWHPS